MARYQKGIAVNTWTGSPPPGQAFPMVYMEIDHKLQHVIQMGYQGQHPFRAHLHNGEFMLTMFVDLQNEEHLAKCLFCSNAKLTLSQQPTPLWLRYLDVKHLTQKELDFFYGDLVNVQFYNVRT